MFSSFHSMAFIEDNHPETIATCLKRLYQQPVTPSPAVLVSDMLSEDKLNIISSEIANALNVVCNYESYSTVTDFNMHEKVSKQI